MDKEMSICGREIDMESLKTKLKWREMETSSSDLVGCHSGRENTRKVKLDRQNEWNCEL